MNNLTVAKTVGNWGNNKDLDQSEQLVLKEEKISLSFDQLLGCKESLISNCNALISNAEMLYCEQSYKELHDAIITLYSVKRSLDRIQIKNQINELNK